jgi:chromate reductase
MTQILGISGSLRKASYNTSLLRTASDLAPDGISIQIFNLSPLPLYNDGLAKDDLPSAVIDFRNNIKQSGGILIASPEYNYSFTGVLKNAIDWASTDTLGNILAGKPTAIMGASPSVFGTARSQLHLRQVLIAANATNANVIQRPEIYARRAQTMIDEHGNLNNDHTREIIQSLLAALIDRIKTTE